MFVLALLFFTVWKTWAQMLVMPCEIGDNQVALSTNGSHSYFLRCRDYIWNGGNTKDGTTLSCVEVKLFGNATSSNFAQPCGPSRGLYTLKQRIIPDPTCQEGYQTNVVLSSEGYLVLQKVGCWEDLEYTFDFLPSYPCGQYRGETCGQVFSIQCTNIAWSLDPSRLFMFSSLVLFLLY
jgi:hypothetical protein